MVWGIPLRIPPADIGSLISGSSTFSKPYWIYILASIISYSVGDLFVLMTVVSFTLKSFLVWCSFVYFLLLFPLPEETFPKHILTKIFAKQLTVCFLLQVLWFQILHLNLQYTLNLLVCLVWESSPVSFACTCPIFPTPFIEEIVISHYIFFPPLSQINCPECGFISWLFCFIDPLPVVVIVVQLLNNVFITPCTVA